MRSLTRIDCHGAEPQQPFATQSKAYPLVIDHFGKRGPHFEAILWEFASILIKSSSGCRLMQGRFAISPTVALAKIISCSSTRLAWTSNREHVAQIIRAIENHKCVASFTFSLQDPGGPTHGLGGEQFGWHVAGGRYIVGGVLRRVRLYRTVVCFRSILLRMFDF
jgi:hypothetical protein